MTGSALTLTRMFGAVTGVRTRRVVGAGRSLIPALALTRARLLTGASATEVLTLSVIVGIDARIGRRARNAPTWLGRRIGGVRR